MKGENELENVKQNIFDNNDVFSLNNISFSYSKEKEAPLILKDIHLSIKEGERILILGPSGAGKSTLLSILSGFVPRIIPGQLTGNVKLKGQDAKKKKIAEFATSVATVMQNPESQLTSLTVEDEVAFALENFKLPSVEIRKRVNKILKQTQMEELRNREVYTLSGDSSSA